MHKYNDSVYFIINCCLLFLSVCVLYLLRPVILKFFTMVLKIIAPFLIGFIISALIYPLLKNINNILFKMIFTLIIYLIIISLLIITISITLPRLIEDYRLFCSYFKIDPLNIDLNKLNSSFYFIGLIFNGIVISLFYTFDHSLIKAVTKFIPNDSQLIVRYYLFIQYFYQLLKHILIKSCMIFVILSVVFHPYALLISLLSLITVIPIIGNTILYSVLFLCLWYYPIILLPLVFLISYDLIFYKKYSIKLLYLVLSLVILYIIHPFLIIFSLPFYFLMIEIIRPSYSTIRGLKNE